jgi:TatD DNase family protein
MDETPLLDAHFHLDLSKGTPGELVAEREASIHIIAVTNAPSVFHHTEHICSTHERLHAAVGLHPELVASHGNEVETLVALLPTTRFVGEVGLDYVTTDTSLRAKQRKVFARILEACSVTKDKVLTIHSRRAAADVVAAIAEMSPGIAILHWFSGSRRELDKAIEAGCFFSVNPAMTRSKSGLSLIHAMPSDRVLTETDGPFVKIGDRPARPADVTAVVGVLAKVWKVSESEARATVWSNFSTMCKRDL